MTKKDKRKIVQMILHQNLEKDEKEDIIDLLADSSIAIDVDKEEERNLTFSEKAADKISEIAGSWTFIFISIIFLIGWMIINTFILKDKEIDPYPYILLNLILSCISALQAPIIMMSQNRASKKDSLRNQNDYKIDLKSELLLEDLHHKVEVLINNQNRLLNILDKAITEEENNWNKNMYMINWCIGDDIMLKECRYLDSEKIINLTLFLTIENENRYIIDCYDIARFLKIITENLKKQNLDIIEGREPICQNDNFEIYNDEESESTYYLLYPWLDIKAFATSFAGTLSNEVIKACYQDNLYQNLPPRSDEDLEKLNQIYQKFIDKKEEENTQQSEIYNYRKKQIIKQRQRINMSKQKQ